MIGNTLASPAPARLMQVLLPRAPAGVGVTLDLRLRSVTRFYSPSYYPRGLHRKSHSPLWHLGENFDPHHSSIFSQNRIAIDYNFQTRAMRMMGQAARNFFTKHHAFHKFFSQCFRLGFLPAEAAVRPRYDQVRIIHPQSIRDLADDVFQGDRSPPQIHVGCLR